MESDLPTPFMEAATSGDVERLKQAIETQKASLSEKAIQGLLTAVAWKSHEPIVSLLLSNYPSLPIEEETVRAAIYSGFIPLCSALFSRDPSLVNLAFDRRGTPLIIACLSRQSNSFLTFLLESGADPNQDPDVSPYPIAAVAAFYEDTDAAALLLRHGAEMKHTGALTAAAARGNDIILRYLLENGADHETDCVQSGRPDLALHVAAKRGYISAAKILLEHGVDPCVKNAEGKTALETVEEVEKWDGKNLSEIKEILMTKGRK
ncbi:ankyrin repeat-containing domain protein [Camillea tinctor]|nr:ankyrin repeat-containing domain protein [Camillea tinctor]